MNGPTRWRPSLEDAERLSGELAAVLVGKRIEKVWRPSGDTLSFKIQGEPRRLLLQASPTIPHGLLVRTWPENPHNPDRIVLMLRQSLTNARIRGVHILDERILGFTIESRGETLELGLQIAGRFPNINLISQTGNELVRLISTRPGRDKDSPPLAQNVEPWSTDSSSFLEALEEHIASVSVRATVAKEVTHITRETRVLLKRAKRALVAVQKDMDRAGRASEYRQQGELLKSCLHTAKKGMSEVKATDWSTGEAREFLVPLDPLLTPKENLERLFRRYRKFSGALHGVSERLTQRQAKHEALTSLMEKLALLSDLSVMEAQAGLTTLTDELRGLGWSPSSPTVQGVKKPVSSPTLPYREFKASDGTTIWLGRSAKHNDKLTLHHAKGHDIWLHARDSAGSHVILRCARNAEPSSDSLVDAALLAAWHSKQRGESIIDIMWTRRKNVRKPKGAAPGSVTVSDSRTISVRDDPKRLRRIYDTESD
jgi:predicted ribosome quality control (RQC) complex YloA/Tae2 family protein